MQTKFLLAAVAAVASCHACSEAYADTLVVRRGTVETTFTGDIVGTIHIPGRAGLHVQFLAQRRHQRDVLPNTRVPPHGGFSWVNEEVPPATQMRGSIGNSGEDCKVVDWIDTQSDDDYIELACAL